MRGLLPLAWDNLRHSWRSQLATALAVALSVAFIVIILSLGSSLNRSVENQVAEPYATADLVVDCGGAQLDSCADPEELLSLVASLPEVETAAAWDTDSLVLTNSEGKNTYLNARVLLPGSLRTEQLSAGSWPTASTDSTDSLQVALDASTAQALGVGVDDTVTLECPWKYESEPLTVQVVGLIDSGSTASAWLLTAEPLPGASAPQMALMDVTSGTDLAQVQAGIEQALSEAGLTEASVSTAQELRDQAVADITDGQDVSTWFFMVFAVVALLLSVAIVSTTATVTLQRRRRESALMRCTGATTGQMRTLLLWESALVGLFAGLVGLALSALVVALGFPALGVADDWADALTIITSTTALVAVLLSVGVCVVASLRAVRSTARVSPMAVLSSVQSGGPVEASRRRRALGWATALVLGVTGGAAAWLGTRPLPKQADGSASDDLLTFALAVLGGVLLLLAVLVVTVLVAPRLGGPISRLLRKNEAARMGAMGMRQSGGRAGATAAIMLVGVALVTATFTGAATIRASLLDEISQRRPVDAMVSSSGEGFSDTQLAQVAALDGVAQISRSRCVPATYVDESGEPASVSVVAVNLAEWSQVARSAADVPPADGGLVDSFGQLQGVGAAEFAFADGESVRLDLQAAPTRTVGWEEVRVSAGALPTAVLEQAETCRIWVRADDELSSVQANELLASLQETLPEAELSGGLTERLSYEEILSQILKVVLGLLGVSLVVCVVGLTNVLFLGVGERGRELATLRAVGMTRRQTAVVVLTEGLVLAGVALLLGLLTGVGLGTLASDAVVVQMRDVELRVVIPWAQLLAVAGVTIAVSGIAAVFPAWRASRISPISALVEG